MPFNLIKLEKVKSNENLDQGPFAMHTKNIFQFTYHYTIFTGSKMKTIIIIVKNSKDLNNLVTDPSNRKQH